MKKVILFILFGSFSFITTGQKYEVWVYSGNKTHFPKWTLDSSNDSVLSIYSIPRTIFLSPRYEKVLWTDIEALKVRNKTMNRIGTLAGAGAGLLLGLVLAKNVDDRDLFGGLFVVTAVPLTTAFIGYLATSAKISIPLYGKSSKEKNRIFRDHIKMNKP